MSVFKRSGSWVAKFQLRGEQHWVPDGPWPTKSAAREAERRYRDRLDSRRTDETCASFAARWLAEWPRPAVSTQRLYAYAMRRFTQDFGPTRLDEVERLSARSWALGVPRNVSRVVGIMYEDARNIGLVENNPFSNLRLPANEKTQEVVPPTLDEYRELLEACTVLGGYGAEFRAMIQFSAWTGVRAGELHALRWEDVGADTIRIRGARKRDGEIGKPKNGKEREVAYLPPHAFSIRWSAGRTGLSSTRLGVTRSCRARITTRGGRSAPHRSSRWRGSQQDCRTSAGTTCGTSVRPSYLSSG